MTIENERRYGGSTVIERGSKWLREVDQCLMDCGWSSNEMGDEKENKESAQLNSFSFCLCSLFQMWLRFTRQIDLVTFV